VAGSSAGRSDTGIRKKKNNPAALGSSQLKLINTFFEHSSHAVRKASLQLLKIIGINNAAEARTAIAKAVTIASDKNQPKDKREDAIQLFSELRNHCDALCKFGESHHIMEKIAREV
jgi:hypothetical protein